MDFGPWPFRFFNHSLQDEGFNVIRDFWCNLSVQGQPSFLLKQKLKLLKVKIKEWLNLNPKPEHEAVQEATTQMIASDIAAESCELSSSDCENFTICKRAYFKAESQLLKSLRQKSRVKWALEEMKTHDFSIDWLKVGLRRTRSRGIT